MQLKIASITNLTDARFFSAIGAHYLGFCFDVLNENNISITKAQEIINWLHEPVIVGEFGNHQTKEEIQFIAEQMTINEIQIPFLHNEKQLLNFDKFLVADDFLSINDALSPTDYFVIKTKQSDINNPVLQNFISNNKVFIEADFTKDNIEQIIDLFNPFGIQITCKKETKPGFSFVDEYAEILEIIGFS
jgi:phosphoribosylanthranilate isomerase